MNLNLTKIAYCFWMFGIVAAAIFSLVPIHGGVDIGFFVFDKFLHLFCYAFLSHIACHAGTTWNRRYLLCFVTFAVSIIIEFLQPLTGRSFEGLDIIANLGGVILGIMMMKIYLWRFGS